MLEGESESEVEIARVRLESTTGDAISVRARPVAGEIHHRVVDEYADEGVTYQPAVERSRVPLALAEQARLNRQRRARR